MSDDFPAQVTGDSGRVYRLSRLLGRGGQGAAFAVEGGRLAVKLLDSRPESGRERLRQQLAYVRRLPLDNLPVAHPVELLRAPNVGYVMELMTAMVPLAELMLLPKHEPSPTAWYFRTGGLRRRLRLLAYCSDILKGLHDRGLVYGDLSPNNVLVSESIDAHEVWLIDADNLHVANTLVSRSVYTRPFGAPELMAGRSGVNTLTDAHAFAVAAFHTLAVTHPLLGDLVNDGEPELEDQALRGELPWIDHPTDNRNRSRDGLPRSRVMTKRLASLAEQAFGAGLQDPLQRPGIGAWAECLHSAADGTLCCDNPACSGTYYVTFDHCPWCNRRRPAYVRVLIRRWIPERENQSKPLAVLALGAEALPLTNRTIELTDGLRGRPPLVELSMVQRGVHVRVIGDSPCWLVQPGKGPIEVTTRPQTIPVEAVDSRRPSWRLHFRPVDQAHRVVTFQLIPEVKA